MNWTNEVLGWADSQLKDSSRSYQSIAAELTERSGEKIHYEQLRGAVRRYRDRSGRAKEAGDVTPRFDRKNFTLEQAKPKNQFHIRFGALGDTHLCSNYELLEYLHRMYDVFKQEGVTNVFHTGNWIDGEAHFNKNDIHIHGMDNQLRYFIANYPKANGMNLYYISGDDHEGWYTQKHGIEIGQHLEDMARRAGREDLVYLGYMEADVELAPGIVVRVTHPGGGSGASISHTSQKIVDGYERIEDRPTILLTGHYHKAEYLPDYRGVHVFQTGCFQMQSPFMRKKRLSVDIGGWIIEMIGYDDVIRVKAEFVRFDTPRWRYKSGS